MLELSNVSNPPTSEVHFENLNLTLQRGVVNVLLGPTLSGVQGELGPKLNEPRDPEYWFNQPGSPKAKLANEKQTAITIDYDELIKSWQ